MQVLEREDKTISKARGHAKEKKGEERGEGKRQDNIADSRETEE